MMEDNTITVRLTRKQLEDLVQILDTTTDEGPMYAGWASPELDALRGLFGAELEAQRRPNKD
jgi:hypothetical protein